MKLSQVVGADTNHGIGNEYKRLIALSKYKDLPTLTQGKKGRMVLQYHGDQVFFRYIKIKSL